MLVKEDMSYLKGTDLELMDKGYAELDIHSIHFTKHFTEEKKTENKRMADSLTSEEWGKHCDDMWRKFYTKLQPIIEYLDSKFDIYQYNEKVSYKTDWDFFFYSNKGWNNKDYYDFFQLNPNDERCVEQKKQDIDNLFTELNKINIDDEVQVRIQYTATLNNEKIKNDALNYIEQIKNTFINYMGMVGKIKVVRDLDGDILYGFFKKGAKNHYYNLSYETILALNWNK